MKNSPHGKQDAVMTRRHFGSLWGAAGVTALAGPAWAQDGNPDTLRVIAYNVYRGQGWPQERPAAQQAVASGEMPRLLAEELKRHRPDIVTLSEAPPRKMLEELAGHLGMDYVRFPSGGHWPGALLSRHGITDAENAPMDGERPEELFTRHWGRGRVTLPDGEVIVVHSAHLISGTDPAVRLREIPLIAAAIRSDLEAGHSVLLMGDFNHKPDKEEYRLWMEAGLTDTFAAAGEGDGFTYKIDDLRRRIDYVMAAGPIAGRIVAAKPLAEGHFLLNVADSEAFALSDHLPQFAEFQLRG